MPDRRRSTLSLVPLMIESGCFTAGDFGRQVGMSRSAVQRLKERGLSIYRADELATKLNIHPEAVWGSAFYTTPEYVGGQLDTGDALD